MSTATAIPADLRLTRAFAAPRQIVFDAWTNPESLAQWWGPLGFTSTVHELDPREGGAIRLHMRGPNGVEHPMTGQFVKIDPPRELVFTSAALDTEGQPVFVNRNTVLFTEISGGTEVTIHAEVMSFRSDACQYLKGMEAGWTSSLERLSELVAHR
jgi:uncharacterized protein YndB with AHSA1/START domain